jgi:hypothetical protein
MSPPEIKVETLTWILGNEVANRIEGRYEDGWRIIGFYYLGLATRSGLYSGGDREFLVIWQRDVRPTEEGR